MADIITKEKIRSRLNGLDEDQFDLLVFKVKGVTFNSLKKERAEITEDIINNENRKSLNELIDDLVNIYDELKKTDPNFLEIAAYRLGKTEVCSENEKIEYIKDIIKKCEKKDISQVLTDWSDLYSELDALEPSDLNNISKKLGIKNFNLAKPEEFIKEILKKGTKKAIFKALKKWDVNTVGSVCSIIGVPLGIIGVVIAIYTVIYGDNIKEWWGRTTTTTSLMITSSTTSSIPTTTSTTIPRPERNHDSFAIEEAEKFFNAVKSASPGTYGENNLPPNFKRSLDIKYEGALILDDNKIISGEMKFSHKKSANIFTLKPDGSVYPSDGNEWTEPLTEMKFVWVSGGCNEKECVEGFWMGKDEVTQGQWKTIMENNPCTVNHGDKNPVQDVGWNDIITFIHKLNEKEKTGKTYRLPKVSEWEHACRNAAEIEHMKDGITEWCENNEEFKAIMGGDSVSAKIFSCNDSQKAPSDYKSWKTGFRLVTHQKN